MATFDLGGKAMEDTQGAVLLPDDRYALRIAKEPKEADNKTKREQGENADGAGVNIVLSLRVFDPDHPEYNERPFNLYLPKPNPSDEGKWTPMGQTVVDSKLDRIRATMAAFSGIKDPKKVKGDRATFEVGQMAVGNIVRRKNEETGDYENNLNPFAGFSVYDGPRP